jgi:hypothetical protein
MDQTESYRRQGNGVMLQRGTTIVVQYVHPSGARHSIRRRDDDRPVAGLFGMLAEAQKEFLRSNQGFDTEG